MANETTQFDEQELEQYGVWVKAGSEEVVVVDGEPTFADLPTDEAPGAQPDDAFESGGGVAEPEGTVLEEFDIDALDLDDAGGAQPSRPTTTSWTSIFPTWKTSCWMKRSIRRRTTYLTC